MQPFNASAASMPCELCQHGCLYCSCDICPGSQCLTPKQCQLSIIELDDLLTEFYNAEVSQPTDNNDNQRELMGMDGANFGPRNVSVNYESGTQPNISNATSPLHSDNSNSSELSKRGENIRNDGFPKRHRLFCSPNYGSASINPKQHSDINSDTTANTTMLCIVLTNISSRILRHNLVHDFMTRFQNLQTMYLYIQEMTEKTKPRLYITGNNIETLIHCIISRA